MRYQISCTVFATIALAVAAAASGQSLGDVARKEEARRKTVAQGKAYSNKDLRDAPPVSPQPPVAGGTAGKSGTAESAPTPDPAKGDASTSSSPNATETEKDKGAKPSGEAPASGSRDQGYWAGRLKELQTQLDRDQTFLTALETRVAALNTDFVNRDDPAQRAVVARDRQKSLEEITRLKQAIQDDRKAIADLQEEARRAGVPPGWLR